jgi:tRNA(adenine34) deaminase
MFPFMSIPLNHAAKDDETYMKRALELALEAGGRDEVPVGALVVQGSEIIAEAFNEREGRPSALAHAELTAIERACERLGRWRLSDCTLYVSLEPCVMCAGGIVLARLNRVVYGAKDPKAGAVESLYQILSDPRLNHRPEVVSGVLGEDCGRVLSEFFKSRRPSRTL